MAGKEIKTTIKIDGERKFQEAISASKQEVKVLGSELKAAAADYQLSGDKMDYLSKRTDVLTREIAEQEKVIRQTSEYLAKAAAGGEQYSSKVNRLKIELNNSEAALSRMRKELQDADRELEELGRDSLTAGRNIERGLTDAAEEASKSVEDMVSEMNANIGKMDFKASLSAGVNAAQAGVQLFQQASEVVNAAMDYQQSLAILRANTEVQGGTWEDVKTEFDEITTFAGDAKTAVEGLSSLLAAGFTSSEDLDEVTDYLIGASVKYPSLSFNNLAEGVQETVATGQAAGGFLELLEKCKIDVEAFNTVLAACQTETAMTSAILAALRNTDLDETYDAYMEQADGVNAYKEAVRKLDEEWQNLVVQIAPGLTEIADGVGAFLGNVTSLVEYIKKLVNGEEFNFSDMAEAVDPLLEWVPVQPGGMLFSMPPGYETSRKPKGTRANKIALEGYTIEVPVEFAGPPTPEWWAEQWEQQNAGEAVKIPAEVDTDEALDGMSSALDDYAKAASGYGEKIGEGVGDGIIDGLRASERGLARQMARINSIIGSGSSGTGTGTTGTGGASELLANLQIDGKTFARMVVPYIDREQGKQWKTTVST